MAKFQVNASRYRSLIDLTTPFDENLSTTDIEDLWSLVDYGLMSKAAAPAILYSQAPVTEWSPSTWLDAGDGLERHLFGDSAMLVEGLGGENYHSDGFDMIGLDFSEHGASGATESSIFTRM